MNDSARARSLHLAKARHDLRTPINLILGYCEMWLEEEAVPARLATDLRKIHRGGKRLLELIARYLDDETFGSQTNLQQLQHELRTPANHIIGYSDLLIEQAGEQGQTGLIADLKKVCEAAQRWLSLMESYLLPAAGSHVSTPTPAETEPAKRTKSKPSAPAKPSLEGPSLAAAPASLLVVDDDDSSRELLARRLHRAGFLVTTAKDGTAALDLVRHRSFNLMLLDFMMPDMDGLEVLRRIRKRHAAAELPVIMVTGRDASGDIVRALKQGANDYLTKPVDFEVALARLNTHLQLGRAQMDLRTRIEEIRRLANDLQIRNDFIKQIFGRYVTTDVVQKVLETPGGLKLGGQKTTVTILMSDLRGFTAMAERLAPEKVVELLNVYLGAMADVIAAYHGLIDEFIGDAILAVFGAPVAREDHAELAVSCALAMQIEMARVNRRLSRRGIAPLEMGIGINTGEVVVGNIGSDKRAKFGVVGSQMNLAGRIQSATVGGEILISAATAQHVGAELEVERTFTVSPKGASPVQLLSVTGVRGHDHLKLPRPVALTETPLAGIAVKCYRLSENKIVAPESFAGRLIRHSAKSGLLETEEPLVARTDLKMEMVTPNAGAPASVVYAKVMDAAASGKGFPLRFTG